NTLGATQNRLEITISNLSSIHENLSSANSRIRDVDVAAETAELAQNQILMQAGVSVLGQANQLPSMVLSLLQG
ncbi:MAG: flagellin, partial [Myxococcota bacterium]|nr:flagellin [Myxococcota bacterium]